MLTNFSKSCYYSKIYEGKLKSVITADPCTNVVHLEIAVCKSKRMDLFKTFCGVIDHCEGKVHSILFALDSVLPMAEISAAICHENFTGHIV